MMNAQHRERRPHLAGAEAADGQMEQVDEPQCEHRFGYLAVADVNAAIGRGRDVDVVGDEHDRATQGVQVLEEREHLGARVGVEVAGRLVGEDQRGLGHQSPGDPDPLLLAARELGGLMVQSIAQAEALEGLLGLSETLAAADALVHQGRGHVLQGARARQQVVALEHEADGAASGHRPGHRR